MPGFRDFVISDLAHLSIGNDVLFLPTQRGQSRFAVLRRHSRYATIAFPENTGRVAKLADAQDLKSCVRNRTCGFEPRLG